MIFALLGRDILYEHGTNKAEWTETKWIRGTQNHSLN